MRPEERRPGQTVPFVFKLKKAMLLGNVTDSFLGGLAIYIKTPMLTEDFRRQLVGLVSRNKGTVPLTIFLTDPETRYTIEFLSKKFQVAVTTEFIEALERLDIHTKALQK